MRTRAMWLVVVAAVVLAAATSAGAAAPDAARTATAGRLHWHAMPVTFSHGRASLDAVDCASAKRCFAVGGKGTPVVLSRHRTGWAPVDNPHVRNGVLTGISCPTATGCVAVGSNDRSAFVDRLRGGRWTKSTIDTTGSDVILWGVDCATRWCAAVGSTQPRHSSDEQPLVGTVVDGRWTRQYLPTDGSTELFGVSCASRTDCLAVGDTVPEGARATQVWSARWDGRTWTALATPVPAGVSSGLRGVSCTSARFCVAVGQTAVGPRPSRNHAVAMVFRGRRWTLMRSPAIDRAELHGVSCARRTCVAVGSQNPGSGVEPLVVRLTGGRWVRQRPQQVAGRDEFDAVHCGSPARCLIAGSTAPPRNTTLVIERSSPK